MKTIISILAFIILISCLVIQITTLVRVIKDYRKIKKELENQREEE